ncbi:MAG: MATE family efflux transporter [Anaerovoracaceae bacterium]
MEHLFKEEVRVSQFVKFVSPSVVMLLVIGLYYIVDSIFVANFVGSVGLAALSIAYPIQGLVWGVSIMLAAGSSAIVAIKMGEGKQDEANQKFTLICIVSAIIGAVFIVLGYIFLDEIVSLLGATDLLSAYCKDYLMILIIATPAAFLGVLFEYFIRVDGKPGFTLILYISGGFVNLCLDYLFVARLGWGMKGAAWATASGMIVVMIMGIAYFVFCKTKLKLVKTKWDGKYLLHTFSNGSSEMVSESSDGITTFFFNMIVIRLAGESGVAALSIVLNVHYLFISIHLGYITGVAPLISYYYGAKDFIKVNIFIKYSKVFLLVSSIALAFVCFFFAPIVVRIFEAPGSAVYDMAHTGVKYLSAAFLFTGINIFASGFFTAYGNGKISALISLSRALVLVLIGVFALSYFFGLHGVWATLIFSEVITLGLSLFMFNKYKDTYNYKLQ